MQLRTILNKFHKIHGFVFENEQFSEVEGKQAIVFPLRPRVGNKPVCSCCSQPRPGYDTLPVRFFQFVPMWGFLVYFAYSMRRVNCPVGGVKVEKVPWGDGKKLATTTYSWFIAHWARLLSWTEVARQFSVSWGVVFRCVETAVEWGRKHTSLDGISAIGIDEIARAKGHKYVTLVYQIAGNQRRLLWIGKERTEATLHGFFDWLGVERSRLIEFVCSDMWKPYLNVIAERASKAVNILDRFHIMSHFSKAIDEVRAGEARALSQRTGGDLLRHSRWALLKRPENLTARQELKLADLMRANLKTVRAYLLKEDFQQLWDYRTPGWADRFLRKWTFRAMRSKLDSIKRVARMIRKHQPLILNWFRAKGQISNGTVEGLNAKGRVITKRAYGFRSYRCLEVALYHTLGDLPEQKFTHRFW